MFVVSLHSDCSLALCVCSFRGVDLAVGHSEKGAMSVSTKSIDFGLGLLVNNKRQPKHATHHPPQKLSVTWEGCGFGLNSER
jgi:hypothetical protein